MSEGASSDTFRRLCKVLFDDDATPPPQPREAAFGRFRLLSELGRGGYGVVWKAHDPLLDREVALKVLPPTIDRGDYERLLREARVPSRLKHPRIVQVHEIGEVEGRPFIVMDLISGAPLSKLGDVPLRKKVEIAAELAETLDAAHSQGVVHRDLKPSNILVNAEGHPVLVDFGLARTIGRDDRVTRTGEVFGTPFYMSPEQAGGSPAEVDARSDLYSLGVILYEMVGGRPPFQSPTPYELLQRILTSEPPRLGPSVPAPLEAVVFKAMAKRKEERYASAGAMARELRAWLGGGAVEAKYTPPKGPRGRPWIPLFATSAVILLAGTVWLALRSEGHPALIPRSAEDPPPSDDKLGWKKALHLMLDGDASAARQELLRIREAAQRGSEKDPKDPLFPTLLSRVEMLEGNDDRALQVLEDAIGRGLPEREAREIQCGIVIATSKKFRFCEHPYLIEFESLLDDSRFATVRSQLGAIPSAVGQTLEMLLMGKEAEVASSPADPMRRAQTPELRLLHAVAVYNMRRRVEIGPSFPQIFEEIPGPITGALASLALMSNGRVGDAMDLLRRIARLPGSDWAPIHYLRGICELETGRFQECERSFRLLQSPRIQSYCLGLLEMTRGNKSKAAEHFRSCGAFHPAEYHLACVTTEDRAGAVALLKKAVNHARAAGEFDVLKTKDSLRSRTRAVFRAVPFFSVGPDVIMHDPLLQPLRDFPETERELRALSRL